MPEIETFENGKKYQVMKAWSREPVPGITTERWSVSVGEVLRFVGPNFDGAWFRDAERKKIVLPVKVAFRIMGNLTKTALDGFPPNHRDEPFCERAICMGMVSTKTAASE